MLAIIGRKKSVPPLLLGLQIDTVSLEISLEIPQKSVYYSVLFL